MPKPDSVAVALVKAAHELHSRHLWTEVASDVLFLLRLPAQPNVLVGAIMGQAGEQFGLHIVRGEGALQAMLRLLESEGDGSALDAVTVYGVTVQPLGELEPPLRTLVAAAGLQLRREASAPAAVCKPAGGHGRPANRSEWRLLARCVEAVLIAHAAGEFRPEAVDPRRRRILEIVVEEPGQLIPDLRVRTHVVPWPAGTHATPLIAKPHGAAEDERTPWDQGGLPETLDEWKLADRIVTGRLVKAVTDAKLLNKAMLARYFGSFLRAKRAMEQCSGLQPEAGFMEWAFADWWPGRTGRTLLEQRLADPATPSVERALWQGRQEARLSIWRVDATRPGEGFNVEDVLSGERATVIDRALSGSIRPDLFVPLRLMRVGRWDFCALAGPPLSSFDIDPALDLLERHGADLSPGCLRRLPHLVGRLWELAVERGDGLPRMGNSDGDLLEFHAATFRVLNPAACARDLDARKDLDRDEDDTAWDWVRPDPSDPKGERLTVLGRLQLLDDRLVLEVNSARRLARARQWIEKLPGVRFDSATVRALDAERPLDDRLKSREPRRPWTADERQQVEQILQDQYRLWLDRPLPVLGGRSPRMACRTEAGRRQVAVIVRTMPPATIPGGSIPAPRDWLLRELGIESARAADQPQG